MTYNCSICPKTTEELNGWIVVFGVEEPLVISDEANGVEIRDNRMNTLATCCSYGCAATYCSNQHRLDLKTKKGRNK